MAEICELLIDKLGIKEEVDVPRYLDSVDPTDRIRALTEIAALRLMQYFDRAVNHLLSDCSDDVRQRAAWALDNLNDPRAIPSLLRAINDPSWGVRSGAGWALVYLGDAARSEVERTLRETSDEDAREMAVLILQRL